MPNGTVPQVGQIFRNPELAQTFKLIAAGGANAFYRGAIAKAILKTSARLGGQMDAADLADYQSEWVEPISTDYRGWKVYELPPNGQGMATLEMLNIMERFPLPGTAHDSAASLHYKIEAQKLAYMDLQKYLADPRQSDVPWLGLISKSYAAERAKLIDAKRANCDVAAWKSSARPKATRFT